MNSREVEEFRNWLISSHNLQSRSAGDIISRRNKLLGMIQDPVTLSIDQLKEQLQEECADDKFSRATLSGMVRSEKLYRKFKNSS
jgi:hypothetical protein